MYTSCIHRCYFTNIETTETMFGKPWAIVEDDLEDDIEIDTQTSFDKQIDNEFREELDTTVLHRPFQLVDKRVTLLSNRDPYLSDHSVEHVGFYKWEKQLKHSKGAIKEDIKQNKPLNTEEDVNILTDHILCPDKDGDNLLFIAIIVEDTRLSMALINLISHYSRLQVCNRLYQTALHLGAITDNADVVRRLVVAGIEIERQDWMGNTALHIASIKGFLEVVKALVNAVSYHETKINSYTIPYQPIPQNFEIRNSSGLTCLHLAVSHGHVAIVELLLSKDANINVVEMKAGKTCLHLAAEAGNKHIIDLLLTKPKLKIDKKTFAGYTATELAHYRGHDFIVYMLRCRGAKAVRSFRTIEQDTDSIEDITEDSSECDDDEMDCI